MIISITYFEQEEKLKLNKSQIDLVHQIRHLISIDIFKTKLILKSLNFILSADNMLKFESISGWKQFHIFLIKSKVEERLTDEVVERGKRRRRRQPRRPRDAPMRRRRPQPDEAEAAVHGADEMVEAVGAGAGEKPRGTPSEGDVGVAGAATGRTPPDDKRPPFPAFCSRCSAPQRVTWLPVRPGSGKIVLYDTPCPTTLDPRLHSPSILNRLSRSSIKIRFLSCITTWTDYYWITDRYLLLMHELYFIVLLMLLMNGRRIWWRLPPVG